LEISSSPFGKGREPREKKLWERGGEDGEAFLGARILVYLGTRISEKTKKDNRSKAKKRLQKGDQVSRSEWGNNTRGEYKG